MTTAPSPHPILLEGELDPALTRDRPRFPGWRWVAVWLAFPVAGYIGWTVGGRVDAVGAALVGGALTGAGISAVQWWAADGALGRPAGWIAASAVGFAVGLTAGAALVGYDTDLGALALMGLVTGAALGVAQGLALAAQGTQAPRGGLGDRHAGAARARMERHDGGRHQRRKPAHCVRRLRRSGVHA